MDSGGLGGGGTVDFGTGGMWAAEVIGARR